MKTMRYAAVLAIFTATACGRSIGDKQEAAIAAQRVAAAGQSASSGASPLFHEGLDTDLTVTVKGRSGSAKVTLESSVGEEGASSTYVIVYSNYSPDGENTFDGTVTHVVEASGGLGGASTSVHLRGNVTMTGEFDSTLEMDIRQTSSVSIGTGGASVSIAFDGFITADGTRYEYDSETFAIDLKD